MLARNEESIDREGIEKLIEDVVAKMHKAGKSFKVIARLLVLTEAEVIEAFRKYQQRSRT